MSKTSMFSKMHSPIVTIILIVAVSASFQSLASQELPNSSPGIIQNEPTYHPDGILGQIAARARYLYAAASRGESRAVTDWQGYGFELSWVALEKLSILGVSEIEKQDSVRYTLLGGFRYYFANPLTVSGSTNPDGKIGTPVVSILGGGSLPSVVGSKSEVNLDFELIWPISSRLTLSGSYRYFEKIEPFEVSQAALAVTIYLADYHADSSYVSPDGPLGFPALKLTSGGSENGLFGELDIILPIKSSLTLRSLLRIERTDDPYQLLLAAGFGLNIYPRRP